MTNNLQSALEKVKAISNSPHTIYSAIEIGDPLYWLTAPELEALLLDRLVGQSLAGLANRTRSKTAKELVCDALGYPRPKKFEKCQPRFKGQDFDTYVQKSINLQIWNEEISPTRRYVLLLLDDDSTIVNIKVLSGQEIALLDKTGTLTSKYQAILSTGDLQTELVSKNDTLPIQKITKGSGAKLHLSNPTDDPVPQLLLPIDEIFHRLKGIINISFKDAGIDQERNRGGELHKIVCQHLGYSNFQDNGQFPDVKHQLLEVKLQTSPTIDLGLVTPSSKAHLDISKLEGIPIRHCDVRYALFYGNIVGGKVNITNFYLTTGEDFFERFSQMQGKQINSKLQIPLPRSFFSDTKQLGLLI